VGRLAREKQQETLLRAVGMSRHRQSLQIVLAGVGPREQMLERLAQRLGVDARIGWVDDDELLGLYGAAELFVHAGTIELEGMSVLEAMAAGNTVIVSDSADSACASIVHEVNARFVRGEPADLARRIDYWLEHPEQSAIQGRLNRQFAESLRHDSAARKLKSFYQDVLAQAPQAASAKPRLTEAS
jgi:glycosyltransferase involved in cell wall biosynthesis